MVCFLVIVFCVALFPVRGITADIDELMNIIPQKVSGLRARDYTMRLWRYDKWSTLPMWQKAANEARLIMEERNFDEAEVVDSPADGRTKVGDWVNPLGWDVKSATLEVIEPAGIPDEYRYLADYLADPTSLGNWSCPTPPEGIEAELVILESPDLESLKKIDARGKILLTTHGIRHLKRYLEDMGIPGAVCAVRLGDFTTAHRWLNGWSDMPGGWLMNDYDSKKQFRFSISQKQGEYLRNLIRQGKTVKVRAKIDSRYYTDSSIPYVTGYVKGSGSEREEVLIVGHLYEWGANDNSTGCASILESVGTLNDLIRAGKLPRPKRGIRVCFGHEMWGMMAYTTDNLERLRTKTIASVNVDGPAGNRELSKYHITVFMNPNCTPSYTDALFPEVVRRYYGRFVPYKLHETHPYGFWDNLFCDPSIGGVPSNTITFLNMNVAYDMYHNSMDTIDLVDPRSLNDIATINALYLYYLANAGYDETQSMGQLTFDHGVQVILEKARERMNRLDGIDDGVLFGKELADGARVIEYYTGLQQQALESISRIVPEQDRQQAGKDIERLTGKLGDYGELAVKQFRDTARDRAKSQSLKIVKYRKPSGDWETEAVTIIPKRKFPGTITLMDIPHTEWREVTSSPKGWSAGNWATASLWWCDGSRNLCEIKELVEFEAGRPVRNFDLINYYRFLEERGLVEFVR